MNWAEMYLKKINRAGGFDEYLRKKDKRAAGALIKRMSVKLQKGSKILEIGTGTGAIGILLSKNDFNVVAIDNNVEMFNIASKFINTHSKNCRVLLMDAKDTLREFGKDSFDCVILHGILQHYSNLEIIRLIDTQLSVAPIVIFTVPTKHMSKKYRSEGFGGERYISTRERKDIIKRKYVISDVYGFGFKETNFIQNFLEKFLNNNVISKFFAPFCAVNEFWIKRLK
jgi:2-polyprenyl-3-methyl-5-hydroxy-6-metoxy-1,4-benzoquinol methylase